MRVTIEVNDEVVTSVTSQPTPTAHAAAPGSIVQSADVPVFNAGAAPSLPKSGIAEAGGAAGVAGGTAGAGGQPATEAISAGAAPAELVSGPGAAEGSS